MLHSASALNWVNASPQTISPQHKPFFLVPTVSVAMSGLVQPGGLSSVGRCKSQPILAGGELLREEAAAHKGEATRVQEQKAAHLYASTAMEKKGGLLQA